jgi:hypothetical protein
MLERPRSAWLMVHCCRDDRLECTCNSSGSLRHPPPMLSSRKLQHTARILNLKLSV